MIPIDKKERYFFLIPHPGKYPSCVSSVRDPELIVTSRHTSGLKYRLLHSFRFAFVEVTLAFAECRRSCNAPGTFSRQVLSLSHNPQSTGNGV